jgi:hypothetical protein
LVERGGDVRSFPIQRATLKNIKPIIVTGRNLPFLSGSFSSH